MRRGCILVGPLPPPETGQSVSFEMLVRELKIRGYDARTINLGRRRVSTASGLSLWRAAEILQGIAALFEVLLAGYKRVYITIAQSRTGFIRDCVMIFLARLFGAHVVVHLKGGNYDGFYYSQSASMQKLIRVTLRQVERILVLGAGLQRMYRFDPELLSRTAVVPNGLPIRTEGTWKPEPLRCEPVRIIFLSNLITSKGYLDTLEALAQLVKNGGNTYEAVYAGRFMASSDDAVVLSPEEAHAQFQERVEKLALTDCVRYVGAIQGEEKWKLLKQSHFFVLPTAYINEGQPVSIIEAMASGCVVVSTRFRAIPDLVEHERTGILVDFGAPRQIASAMSEILSEPGKFERMSRAAVERYRERFTMEAHLRSIIPHLNCMASESDAASRQTLSDLDN